MRQKAVRRGLFMASTFLAGTASLTLAAPRAAQAQVVSSILPIRLKLGVLLPNDGDTKTFAGSTHYSAEADVGTPVSGGGQSFLSIGISEGQHSGRTYQVIPVGLSKVTFAGNPVAGLTGNIYYGAGVGLYFLHSSGGGTQAQSKTRYGAFLQAGYQTPFSFFIEGKYHFVNGDLNGLGASGLSLFIGKKL